MTIEIANRLVEWRKQNRLSQEELAEKIGVSRQAVSKWERAESSPDTDNLIELARLYNVSLDELLYTTEPVGMEMPEEAEAPETGALPDAQTAPGAEPGSESAPAEPEQDVISIGPASIKISLRRWRRMFADNPKWLTRWRFPVSLLVTIVYLLMGFFLHLWHPGWIIFFVIPSYYFCAAMCLVEGLRKKLFLFPVTFVCLSAFLLLGFYGRLWHPAWVVFLLIPAYYSLVGTFIKK